MNKQDLIQLCEEAIQQESGLFISEYPWAKVVVPAKQDKVKGGLLEPWWELKNDQGELMYISGIISGDSRFSDGNSVRTSYVVDINYDEELGKGEVETRNTVYTLGKKLKALTGAL